MPSVLFLSNREDDPSTRYRALAYFEHLRRAGYTPLHMSADQGWGRRWRILRRARRSDVVIVLRKTFVAPFRAALRTACRRLVLDIDDAVWLRDDGSTSGTRAGRFAGMARRCDAVLAGNDYLAEHARRFNGNVAVAPTTVESGAYPEAATHADQHHIDLAWIGSAATRKYVETLLPVLRDAAKADARLRLKVIADFKLPDAGLPVLHAPWSQQTEAAALASSHIGIAPLPDNAWTRGKCGLKLLQYMAARLPVIASPTGVQRRIVAHEQTGLLCESPGQWLAAIAALSNDAAARACMGGVGRQHVERHYSVSATFPRWLRAIETTTPNVARD